jgi:hypothetical protein
MIILDISKALNIAVGCILASPLENNEKREVINKLRSFDEIIELVEYREYSGDAIVDMIENILNR